MRKLVVSPLALVLTLAVAVPAVSAGEPAQRITIPVTDVATELDCGTMVYAVVSGELTLVVHETFSASGNLRYSETAVLHDVLAEDATGVPYAIRGASHDGGTFRVDSGGVPGLPTTATFTETLQIIPLAGGGTVGSVRLTHHLTNQGGQFVLNELDLGPCTENSNPE